MTESFKNTCGNYDLRHFSPKDTLVPGRDYGDFFFRKSQTFGLGRKIGPKVFSNVIEYRSVPYGTLYVKI